MKKMIVLITIALLAMPMIASAALQGDCYDCHTMHNSEQNAAVVAESQPNLLRYDCLGCHAQDPSTGIKNWTGPGGSIIPQVAHGNNGLGSSLAGGNFNQATSRKVHSVSDVVDALIVPAVPLDENVNNQPPGISHSSSRHVFTSDEATNAFDLFTCAGARGCHGTRSQALVASTVTNSTGGNNWEIDSRRTGIAAISGAHHNNTEGAKTGDGYNNLPASHDGAIVAEGYRFIPGLKGFENDAREFVSGTDHNEYYGVADGFYDVAALDTSCDSCHVQDTSQSNTRAGFLSGITTPNHSMSGFCSTCHGNFHAAGGAGINPDRADNGVSGAFLRHPSDYVLPTTGDYGHYLVYDESAPVARDYVPPQAWANVVPGDDMVMCLSCHVAHGSQFDYMLRFNYTTMTAGTFADSTAAQAAGGCLACHANKGVAPGAGRLW